VWKKANILEKAPFVLSILLLLVLMFNNNAIPIYDDLRSLGGFIPFCFLVTSVTLLYSKYYSK
jgi:hypothetical protein